MPEIKDSNKNLFAKYTLEEKQRLYDAAAELYSENKRQLFDRLVQNRTRHICVVLEDIFQSHNASAVLRSCGWRRFICGKETKNMARMKPHTLSGFMELLPADQAKMEKFMETLRRSYSLYGFTPLDTPVIEAADVLLHGGVDMGSELTQEGHELMTDAVALVVEGGVGAVFDMGEAVLVGEGFDVGSSKGKQRTDDVAMEGLDAVEAGKTGASEKVDEEGLGGVVTMVCCGDEKEVHTLVSLGLPLWLVTAFENILEEGIAEVAGRLLDGLSMGFGVALGVELGDEEGNPIALG